MAEIVAIKAPTNGGEDVIRHSEPYSVTVTITGTADLLFHAWNSEAVDEKASAAKNSAGKKQIASEMPMITQSNTVR